MENLIPPLGYRRRYHATQSCKSKDLNPLVWVSNVEAVLAFYRLLDSDIERDHDQGLERPTIRLGGFPVTFCLGSNCKSCGTHLVYTCDDLDSIRTRLASCGSEKCEAINDDGAPMIEYHVLPQLTVTFEQAGAKQAMLQH